MGNVETKNGRICKPSSQPVKGAIELTGTRPRRGATEHFYRAKWRVRVEAEPVE